MRFVGCMSQCRAYRNTVSWNCKQLRYAFYVCVVSLTFLTSLLVVTLHQIYSAFEIPHNSHNSHNSLLISVFDSLIIGIIDFFFSSSSFVFIWLVLLHVFSRCTLKWCIRKILFDSVTLNAEHCEKLFCNCQCTCGFERMLSFYSFGISLADHLWT